jgi:hypothetical protein
VTVTGTGTGTVAVAVTVTGTVVGRARPLEHWRARLASAYARGIGARSWPGVRGAVLRLSAWNA